MAASQDALSLIIERLQQGTVSTLDVITVENTLLSNELALLSIQTRQRTSTVQLIKALGGGWKDTQIPEVKSLSQHLPENLVMSRIEGIRANCCAAS